MTARIGPCFSRTRCSLPRGGGNAVPQNDNSNGGSFYVLQRIAFAPAKVRDVPYRQRSRERAECASGAHQLLMCRANSVSLAHLVERPMSIVVAGHEQIRVRIKDWLNGAV